MSWARYNPSRTSGATSIRSMPFSKNRRQWRFVMGLPALHDHVALGVGNIGKGVFLAVKVFGELPENTLVFQDEFFSIVK